LVTLKSPIWLLARSQKARELNRAKVSSENLTLTGFALCSKLQRALFDLTQLLHKIADLSGSPIVDAMSKIPFFPSL